MSEVGPGDGRGENLRGSLRDGPPGSAGTRPAARDALFLAAVIALSCVLYLPHLGLYSDDWAFLARLHAAGGASLPGLFEAILEEGILPRPLQALNLAVLYRLFELDPLGYHVVNSLVLVGAVVLLHRVLRRLGAPTEIAVAVPLVFGLLPHYSTDRFWIAAFQANLSVLALLASLSFDLRFVRSSGSARWAWKVLGTVALLASVLAYEITGPLFLLTPFLVWYGTREPGSAPSARGHRGGLPLLLGSNVLALALAVAYKSGFTDRTGLSGALLWRLRTVPQEATLVGFGSYGVGLPVKVGRAVRDHFDPAVLGLSLLVGTAVWAYLSVRSSGRDRPFPRPACWAGLMAAGGIVFAAGYAVALVTLEVGFETTGINNRTAIAAALGVACVFVGAAGLVAAWLPGQRLRRGSFRGLVALTAFGGTLLVNTIGTFWVSAAREQDRVVEALRSALPAPPAGAVVLLDGVCPYVGPGIVFETSWDVTGMLRIVYGDHTLRGDVIKPGTEVGEDGIRTILYDDVINEYPYHEGLLVVRVVPGSDRGTVGVLADFDDARRILDPDREWSCPPGDEGSGVPIF